MQWSLFLFAVSTSYSLSYLRVLTSVFTRTYISEYIVLIDDASHVNGDRPTVSKRISFTCPLVGDLQNAVIARH